MDRSKLMTIIYLSIVGLFLLIFLFFQLAPLYTGCLLVIFLLVAGYICTEQWFTHDAAEFENRFWTFIAFLVASASLLTCPDSPFYFPVERRPIAWFIVVLLTFIAHNYDRYLHRLTLTKNTNIIKRIKSADFDHTNRMNAKLLLSELQKQVNSIDLIWMSSTFLNIFFCPYVIRCEKRINEIFQDCNKEEINYLLYQCKLPLILYKIKDHKIRKIYSRSKLLQLLVNDRIHELNVSSKAILLDALQRLKLSAHEKNEEYVLKIFTSTKGNDLSELKCLTDSKGDFNSMHKLIFEDIRNITIRERILNHINREANIQSAHQSINTKVNKKILKKFAWMKIISDVDDTLSCSGGSWPKGMDLSYPSKAIYPGVIGFYRELDLGTAGDEDEWDSSTRIGNLAFLSARPHVYKDVSESITYDKFRTLQQNYHLHTSPTLLAGSLESGGRFMVNSDSEPLALKKFENFLNYLRIYPEFQFIFIGDNGQGDVRTAELMHEETLASASSSSSTTQSGGSTNTNNNLTRCYMHIVQPLSKTFVKNPLYKRRVNNSSLTLTLSQRRKKEHKICFFVCYVEAAIDAYRHNLIRLSGLRRIMMESVNEFQAMKEKLWSMDNPYDESYLIESDTKISSVPGRLVRIEDDIRKKPAKVTSIATSTTTRRASATSPVPSTPSKPAPSSDSTAATTSLSSQPNPSSTEISLQTSSQDEYSDSQQHYHDQLTIFTSQTLRNKNGFIKKELRLRELNQYLEKANEILVENELEPVSTVDYTQTHSNGKKVRTVFGIGEIISFRPRDGIYEVHVEQSFVLNKIVVKEASVNVSASPNSTTSSIVQGTNVIAETKKFVTKIYVAGMYLYNV